MFDKLKRGVNFKLSKLKAKDCRPDMLKGRGGFLNPHAYKSPEIYKLYSE